MKSDLLVVERVNSPEPALISLIAALEDEIFGRGGLNEWHLPIIARQGALFVAKESEAVVGALSLIRTWSPKRAFLIDLAVAAGKRRQGCAKKLMSRARDYLVKEGFKQIELTVAVDNEPAWALYSGFGFKQSAEYPDEYGVGRDRVLMRLDLL